MAAETFEARTVAQPIADEAYVLFKGLIARIANVETTSTAALPTAHVDPHPSFAFTSSLGVC